MTDKEKLDAIRAEIHRLVDVRGYDKEMANDLFAFMDSLPNEPISEDLEEAALRANMIKKDIPKEYLHEYPYNEYGRRKFIEGAQWQKQNDEKAHNENALLYNARLEGIEIGKAEMKQQMMKEAKLYGWVARDENGSLHLFEVEPSRIEDRGQWWDRDYNCTTLDKNDFPDLEWEDEPVYVKLIIIKENKQ